MKLSCEEDVRELCVTSLNTMALFPLNSSLERAVEGVMDSHLVDLKLASPQIRNCRTWNQETNSREVGSSGRVPSRGRRETIIRVDKGFEPLSQYLFLNREHQILIAVLIMWYARSGSFRVPRPLRQNWSHVRVLQSEHPRTRRTTSLC